MVFPARDQAEVVQSGKKPLHLPAPPVTAQRSAILSFAAPPSVGRDWLDAVLGSELLVEPVRVVGLVPDEPGRKLVEEAAAEYAFDKTAFCRARAFNRYGERYTVSRGDSNNLGALAPAGRADREPSFFALAKVASTNASSRLATKASTLKHFHS